MDTFSSKHLLIDGQILFAPLGSLTTYLIDRDGDVNHTWTSNYLPGEGVRWLGDGAILRTIKVATWGGGGVGGGVQIIQWDGTVSWEYRYSNDFHVSHHDVLMLSNGNVLLIAWEVKSRQQAIDAGRNPGFLQGPALWPDHIVEVKPTGPTSGTIVWQWHVWDHLIQDYDPSKGNYGVVAEHPELVDINYGLDSTADWLHVNSIDYNPALDQILISAHNFGEVWIIDHSTTTQEAAGHTGGCYGHGGDLLYRWGNPQAYRTGTAADQIFFNQHDATWIKNGRPGAGDILVFNNGGERLYSSVDEFTPPLKSDGNYTLQPGSAYGPTNLTWTYTATPPQNLYNFHLSGAERLTDGDTLICSAESGYFFEINAQKMKVWEYSNTHGPKKEVFKIVFIPPSQPPKWPNLDCSGSLSWTKVHPGDTVTGRFYVRNIGADGSLLNWSVNTSQLTWGNWTITPQSGEDLTPGAGNVTVLVSVVAPNEAKGDFQGYIHVYNLQNASDSKDISVTMTTSLCDPAPMPRGGLLYYLRTILASWQYHHRIDLIFHWFLHCRF